MPSFGQNLDVYQIDAVEKVNQAIGSIRASVATDIAFQQEVYYKKKAEAKQYLATQPINLKGFPLLRNIAKIRGLEPRALAKLWVSKEDDWSPVLNSTEILREKYNQLIQTAKTRADVDAALTDFAQEIAAL